MEYIERFGLLEKQKTWHRKKNVVWRRIVESNQSQDGILDDDDVVEKTDLPGKK